MKVYKINYDLKLIIFTVILIFLLLIVIVLNDNIYWHIFFFGIVSVLSITVTKYFPTGLIEDNNTIKISRLIADIVIKNVDIIKVERIKYFNYPMIWSTKGIFGYLGIAMDSSISMITNNMDVIIIVTAKKKYLISVQDSKSLCNSFKLK